MTEKQILVKDLKINYKIFSDKRMPFGVTQSKTFLVLHGWGSSSDKWIKVGELLAQKNFILVIPDLPGFGKSQEPNEPWNLDNYVEWLNEFSEKLPELNKSFYLVGHSFGGALAAKFSIKYNQKIEKLFLVSASCIRKKTFKKKFLSRISKLFKILYFLPFYNLMKKAFYKFIVGGEDYLNVEKTMKETFLKVVSQDISNYLSFIKLPTVIIWGDKDELTPVNQAKIINKKIENSKLIMIKNARHALQIEVPEILSQKILDSV